MQIGLGVFDPIKSIFGYQEYNAFGSVNANPIWTDSLEHFIIGCNESDWFERILIFLVIESIKLHPDESNTVRVTSYSPGNK